jgi:hypothetical protein
MYKRVGLILFGIAVAFLVIKSLTWMKMPEGLVVFIRNFFIAVWTIIILIVLILKLTKKSAASKDTVEGTVIRNTNTSVPAGFLQASSLSLVS